MGLITSQNRPATSRNAVVFACDAGHLPFALFAAHRILSVEGNGNFDVAICMPDISAVDLRHREGPVRFCQVDFSALPEIPMVKAWISNATYFRWVLPAALQEDYGSLFYLDTDTYLARPGIERLFNSLDRPIALAAVPEFQHIGSVDAGAEKSFRAKISDLGGKAGQYYNAGVLVMQPEVFLAGDGMARYVDAARKNAKFLPIHKDQDQGAMNLAFADEILPLNPLYNWCSKAWLHQREIDKYKPYIYHFAGRSKPWNLNDQPFVNKFRDEYKVFLDREFPDHKDKAALKSAAWRRENPRHRFSLFEDIRIALYERRFRKTLATHENANLDAKFDRMDKLIADSVIG